MSRSIFLNDLLRSSKDEDKCFFSPALFARAVRSVDEVIEASAVVPSIILHISVFVSARTVHRRTD